MNTAIIQFLIRVIHDIFFITMITLLGYFLYFRFWDGVIKRYKKFKKGCRKFIKEWKEYSVLYYLSFESKLMKGGKSKK